MSCTIALDEVSIYRRKCFSSLDYFSSDEELNRPVECNAGDARARRFAWLDSSSDGDTNNSESCDDWAKKPCSKILKESDESHSEDENSEESDESHSEDENITLQKKKKNQASHTSGTQVNASIKAATNSHRAEQETKSTSHRIRVQLKKYFADELLESGGRALSCDWKTSHMGRRSDLLEYDNTSSGENNLLGSDHLGFNSAARVVCSAENTSLSTAGEHDEYSALAALVVKAVTSDCFQEPTSTYARSRQTTFDDFDEIMIDKAAPSDCFQEPSSAHARSRQRTFDDSDEIDKAAPSDCFQEPSSTHARSRERTFDDSDEIDEAASSDCFQDPTSTHARSRQRTFDDSDKMDKAAPSDCFQEPTSTHARSRRRASDDSDEMDKAAPSACFQGSVSMHAILPQRRFEDSDESSVDELIFRRHKPAFNVKNTVGKSFSSSSKDEVVHIGKSNMSCLDSEYSDQPVSTTANGRVFSVDERSRDMSYLDSEDSDKPASSAASGKVSAVAARSRRWKQCIFSDDSSSNDDPPLSKEKHSPKVKQARWMSSSSEEEEEFNNTKDHLKRFMRDPRRHVTTLHSQAGKR